MSEEGKTDREIELERIAQEQQELIQKLSAQVISYGRPTKYCDSFIPILLEHVGIKGKSYTSLAFKLGVASVKTMYHWEKRYPQWARAKEVASNGRLGVIEDTLLDLANGRVKGNAAAAIFYAKNAAPDEFKDKREIEMGGNVTYLIDTGIPQRQIPQDEIHQLGEDSNIIEAQYSHVDDETGEESETESERFEDLL